MIQSKFFDSSLREVDSNIREISLLQNALKEKVFVSIKSKRNPKENIRKFTKEVEVTSVKPQDVEIETFGSISIRPITVTPSDTSDHINDNQVVREKMPEKKNSTPSLTNPVNRPSPTSGMPENFKTKYNLKKKIIIILKKPIVKLLGILIFLVILTLSSFLILKKFYGFRFMY